MDTLTRTAGYLWVYRFSLICSVLCALGIATCWCMNLSAVAPVVKVLFENDSLHQYIDQQIDDANRKIQSDSERLAVLDDSALERRTKLQSRVTDATRSLHTYTQVKQYILPFVPRDKFNTIALIVLFIVFGTVLKSVFVYGQEILVGIVVNRTANDIRRDCFATSQRLDMQTVSAKGTTKILSLMTNDIQQMTVGLGAFGTRMIREPLKASACIAAAFFINWRLTLTAILLVPLMGFFLAKLGRMLKKAAKSAMESVAVIYDCIGETFDCFKVVQAFSGEKRQQEQFLKANDDYYLYKMKCVRMNALIRPTSEIMAVIIVVVAFTPGAYMVLRNTDSVFGIQLAAEAMTITELMTMYVLLAGVLDPVRKLSTVFGQVRQGLAGADRVFELIDTQSVISEPESPAVFSSHTQSIRFEDVSFRYLSAGESEVRSMVLQNVSLEVKFGEVVAVVGSNGSGKSTLTSLLPRFIDPESGVVRIDGKDISEYSTSDLRSQIGLVSQETMLFNDSILENIRYGNFSADRETIIEAARQAHAWDFISELPDGIDTHIGAGGGRLSGGQRQRISLARAIVRNPAILILDEATSAIDARSEDMIHGVLKSFSKGRTVFIITHVLSETFLDLVDRIVVMDQGRVAAVGSHAELMQKCALYQRLTQAGLGGHKAAA
ncbi:ABC transporter ATP-binding protein [Fuerstiella marisgermanici]|uniref:Multidrug export ATP-binding/permease protein n=1 Tax=Fuerstiella marisgermanici TaxID=1891926 RepID=A0A1P8W937_9PLAN|nr:ABC transporter ATP-binding protein [Fuerstiella marisgermanici]APZ90576.1 Putative multidrug export ATP-binding/permease protein [Fuerstiella marisgermanici]